MGLKKHKITAYKLKHITMQGEDYLIEINGVVYFPLYSAALVPNMGNMVVYQGPTVAKACVGVVVGVDRTNNTCRIQRMAELHQTTEYHADDVHTTDLMAFLIRRTKKNV